VGFALYVGRSLGVFSVELAGAFLWEQWSLDQVQQSTGNSTNYSLDTFNGFVGVGGRLTSEGRVTRFSAGVAGGAAIRSFNVNRSTFGINSPTYSPSAGFAAPGIRFDLGLLFGSTPGAKFHVGATGWLDFPSEDVVVGPDTTAPDGTQFTSPGRGYLLAHGPEGFVGLLLGVQIGH
jgi:hypothetical protein